MATGPRAPCPPRHVQNAGRGRGGRAEVCPLLGHSDETGVLWVLSVSYPASRGHWTPSVWEVTSPKAGGPDTCQMEGPVGAAVTGLVALPGSSWEPSLSPTRPNGSPEAHGAGVFSHQRAAPPGARQAWPLPVLSFVEAHSGPCLSSPPWGQACLAPRAGCFHCCRGVPSSERTTGLREEGERTTLPVPAAEAAPPRPAHRGRT